LKPSVGQAEGPRLGARARLRPQYFFLGIRLEGTFDHLHAVLKFAIEFQ